MRAQLFYLHSMRFAAHFQRRNSHCSVDCRFACLAVPNSFEHKIKHFELVKSVENAMNEQEPMKRTREKVNIFKVIWYQFKILDIDLNIVYSIYTYTVIE